MPLPAAGDTVGLVPRPPVGRAPMSSPVSSPDQSPALPGPDRESRAWLADLRADGHRAAAARRRLHELLLRAARFEVGRRRGSHPMLRGDLDELALEAAGEAQLAILRKLDDYRGESRFTTWAYKFALLEAAVALRRRAWQGREVPLEPEAWAQLPDRAATPSGRAEEREVLAAIGAAMERELSDHQREVLAAVVLNGVPIDVLAERRGTTRGALYKTIHDARRKLRAALGEAGLRFADAAGDGRARRGGGAGAGRGEDLDTHGRGGGG